MVDFNKMVEEQTPPDLTRGYRTVDSSAVGDLFSNLGKAGENAVAGYISGQENAAESEIASAVDSVFAESGIEEDVNSNPALARDAKSLTKLYKATSMHGGNKGNIYAARLTTLVKDMRVKYPQADIDKIVQKVTGINPKEYLLKTYQNSVDEAEKSEAARQKSWEDIYKTGGPFAASLYQAYGGIPTPDQEKGAKAIWYKYQAERGQIEANTEKTDQNMRREANFLFKEQVTPVMVAVQRAGAALTTRGGLSDDGKKQLLGSIAQARSNMSGMRAHLISKYGGAVKIEDVNKVLKEYDDMLTATEDAVTKDDINMASFLPSANSWTASDDFNKLLEDPKIRTAHALVQGKLVSPEFTGAMLGITNDPDTFETLVKMNAVASVPAEQGITVKDLFGIVQKKNTGTSGQSATYRSTVQFVAEYLADGKRSPEEMASVAQRWLGEGNLSEAANQLTRGGSDLITFLSSPRIIDNISKTNPEIMPNVVSGIFDAVTKNNEFKDQLKSVTKYSDRGSFVETKDGTLVFEDATEKSQGYRPGTTAPSASTMSALGPFNKAMSNLKYAVEKSGQNWDDYKNTLYLGMGIVVTPSDRDVTGSTEDANLQDIQLTPEVLGRLSSGIKAAMEIGEGTAGGQDTYNTLLGYQNLEGKQFGNVKVSEMTLGELKEFTAPGSPYAEYSKKAVGRMATPMGKYQIVGTTLRKLQQQLGLPDDTVFSEEVQDRMFQQLLEGRGYNEFKSGKISASQFANRLASEWEGFEKNDKSFRKLIEVLESEA